MASDLIPWTQLDEKAQEFTGNLATDAVNGARKFFCNTYARVPRAIVNSPLDNPGARMLDGLARQFCEPSESPLPPAPEPVAGGQCECAEYDVTYQLMGVPGYPSNPIETVRKRGPIGPMSFERYPGSNSGGYYFEHSGPNCGGRSKHTVLAGDVGGLGDGEVVIRGIAPVLAETPDCGGSGPVYPAKVPSIGDLKGRGFIPVGGVPTEVDVEINPVKFDVGVQIKPVFNINIGGIQVNAEFTGAKITIAPTLSFPTVVSPEIDPRPVPPQPYLPPKDPELPRSPNPAPGEDVGEALEEILDKLDELKECACKPEDEYIYDSQFLGSGSSLRVPLPTDTIRVDLVVTQQPSNPRFEDGGAAPDVLYAGWAWFALDGGYGVRLPIDSAAKTFYPPEAEAPTQFSFTCRQGFQAQARAWTKRKKQES